MQKYALIVITLILINHLVGCSSKKINTNAGVKDAVSNDELVRAATIAKEKGTASVCVYKPYEKCRYYSPELPLSQIQKEIDRREKVKIEKKARESRIQAAKKKEEADYSARKNKIKIARDQGILNIAGIFPNISTKVEISEKNEGAVNGSACFYLERGDACLKVGDRLLPCKTAYSRGVLSALECGYPGSNEKKAYEVFSNAYKTKFGTPTKVTKKYYQNNYGARFEKEIYTWIDHQSNILMVFPDTYDDILHLYTREGFENKSKQNREKEASNLEKF